MIGISQNSTFVFVWQKSVAPPVLSHRGYAFPLLLIKNKLQLTLSIEKPIIFCIENMCNYCHMKRSSMSMKQKRRKNIEVSDT